jgi:hypothetical protein
VFAAGLIPLIVGSVWYHPGVFGTRWMSYKSISPEMANRASRLSLHTTVVMVVLGMITSFLLSHVLYALSIVSYTDAFITAVFLWTGFIVPVTINRVLWDHEPLVLFGIESGQWLVSLCIMSLVLIY